MRPILPPLLARALAAFVCAALYGVTPPVQAQGVTIAAALDDLDGVWTGATNGTAQQPGWMGVADAAAHDGVDAVRFSRTSGGNSYNLGRQLAGPGTASFWWRRPGEQWSGSPLGCSLANVPVLEFPLTGGWGQIFLSTSLPARLNFAEYPRYQTSWLDEFSFVPAAAGATIGDTLDAPGLEIFALSSHAPWVALPGDAAPGAPPNGCLTLPANVPGGMKIKLSSLGSFRCWTRSGPPGSPWQTQSHAILTTPAVVTVGRFLPQWQLSATQQPAYDYPFFGYNSSSPFLAFSVDAMEWTPAVPVPLAEALDTALPVAASGWEGIASTALSLDGVDSAIARTDYAFLSATLTGPATVRFTASHNTGPYLSSIEFAIDGRIAENVSLSTRLIEFAIPAAGPHTLSWRAPAGSRLDGLSMSPLPPVVSTALTEALDAPGVTLTHDTAADWSGQATPAAFDGEDAAVSPFLTSYSNPLLWSRALTAQFPTAETSRVSFQAKFDVEHAGRYLVELDGLATILYANADAWSEVNITVGPGSHTLRWVAIENYRFYANEPPPVTNRRLMLDQLTIQSIGGPSPAQAIEYPLGIFLTGPPGQAEADTAVSHDGQDSLRVTLAESFTLPLARSPLQDEIYLHLWARTDAESGSVAVNGVVIAGGEWVPLVVFNLDSIEPGLTLRGPPGARVWIDEVVPRTSFPDIPGGPAEALDFPAAQFIEGYKEYFSGAVAHDGLDVIVCRPSSTDDHNILNIVVPATGPATLTFSWRVQRERYTAGDQSELSPAWVTVGDRLNAVLDTRYAGPWRQASVQVPAKETTVRILMTGLNEKMLFLDEIALGPPRPLATYEGAMAAKGLTGLAALPDADGDGDGLTNLAEFVFGSDPASPSSLPDSPLTVVFDNDSAPVVEWRGINPAALPFFLDIEASSELTSGSWASLLPAAGWSYYPPPAFTANADGTLNLTAPFPESTIPDRLFFRARVAVSPPD